jgi:hypothetical protein
MIAVQRHADLVQVVRALPAPGRFAGRLNGRQKQGDQDPNNGDYDQKLDEGKPGKTLAPSKHSLPSIKDCDQPKKE